MQNTIPKVRQSTITSETPGWLTEKLKTLTSSNHNSLIFFAEILHRVTTFQCLQKRVRDFFDFFRSWVINKNVKNIVSMIV